MFAMNGSNISIKHPFFIGTNSTVVKNDKRQFVNKERKQQDNDGQAWQATAVEFVPMQNRCCTYICMNGTLIIYNAFHATRLIDKYFLGALLIFAWREYWCF